MDANRKIEGAAQSREHLLLTVLGTNPRSAVYALGEQECEAELSPLALTNMLEPEGRPSRVLAICTPEAKDQTWETLRRGLHANIHVDPVEVPSTGSRNDVGGFLSAVAEKIPAGADLTVDITHGFRHYSFLTFIAVMYLSTLRDIRVRGVYYGMLQGAPAVSPFIDLGELLELQDLIYAVRALSDTGSALPLATVLGGETGQDRDGAIAPGPSDSFDLVPDLMRLSDAHASGLPLEFGNLVHSLLRRAERHRARLQRRADVRQTVQQHGSGKGTVAKSFGDLLFLGLNVPGENTSYDPNMPSGGAPAGLSAAIRPLVEELLIQLRGMLEPFELRAGAHWKGGVTLDEDELRRQARVIDYQLRCHNTATAIGMMEEWTISWGAWCRDDTREWLNYGTSRQRARAVLASMDQLPADSASVKANVLRWKYVAWGNSGPISPNCVMAPTTTAWPQRTSWGQSSDARRLKPSWNTGMAR